MQLPLHAERFFTNQLALTDGIVIGDTYYGTPTPNSLLRLRIDFARTIRLGEYDGLLLQVLHTELGGVLDAAVLRFAEHDTFRARDDALGRKRGHDGYAVIRDWGERDEPPWQGAATTKLRRAIQQYTALWLPGTAKPQLLPRAARPDLTSHPVAGAPNGFWLTDPDFRTRLEAATFRVLDVIADCLDNDFRLIEALDGARHHTGELHGIPHEFGVLIEAKAAAEIVGCATGSPFDPAVARDLILLDQRPLEEQEQAVRSALRRYASTAPGDRGRGSAPVPPAVLSPNAGRTR
ncbi:MULTISPECIES: hypothetical protein [unclassified Streptomyces]|uniref:hypothetical protein n=1 Tax=unclassified Streptomyces TaxID=2593676 RepID=UPI0015EC4EB2|nr:hypothetical protein [Streptomyces sp. PsTaAH-130]